jgi:hypothetical protein
MLAWHRFLRETFDQISVKWHRFMLMVAVTRHRRCTVATHPLERHRFLLMVAVTRGEVMFASCGWVGVVASVRAGGRRFEPRIMLTLEWHRFMVVAVTSGVAA